MVDINHWLDTTPRINSTSRNYAEIKAMFERRYLLQNIILDIHSSKFHGYQPHTGCPGRKKRPHPTLPFRGAPLATTNGCHNQGSGWWTQARLVSIVEKNLEKRCRITFLCTRVLPNQHEGTSWNFYRNTCWWLQGELRKKYVKHCVRLIGLIGVLIRGCNNPNVSITKSRTTPPTTQATRALHDRVFRNGKNKKNIQG